MRVAAALLVGLALPLSCAAAARRPARPPIPFIRNVGQTDPAVLFHVKGPAGDMYFAREEVVLVEAPGACGKGSVVRLRFTAASPTMRVDAFEPMEGVANFYLGNDPAQWREQVPLSGGVVYRGAWPGVDVIYASARGRLKAEYVVAGGASASSIGFDVVGASSLRVREDGALVIGTDAGEIVEDGPLAWEEVAGKRRIVRTRFIVGTGSHVGFAVDRKDPAARLVIDPVVDYASFVGGSDAEGAVAVAALGGGNGVFDVQLRGSTRSLDFPTLSVMPPGPGSWDAFEMQCDLEGGTVRYVTFVGGRDDDLARAGEGAVTFSDDLPVTLDQPQPAYGGNGDGFYFRVHGGSGLLESCGYVGGSERDEMWADIGSCVAGRTWSADFPHDLPNNAPRIGFDSTFSGDSDGFVSCFDGPNGGRYFRASFVGGSGHDAVTGMQADLVSGWTESADLPSAAGALDSTLDGARDAFVWLFEGRNQQLLATILIGGSGLEEARGAPRWNAGGGVSNHVFVAGTSDSSDFPSHEPTQPGLGGGTDAWVMTLTGDLSAIVYASLIGGSGDETAAGVVERDDSRILVAGTTASADFPLVQPIQARLAGSTDGFAMQVNPFSSPPRIDWATYLGGSGDEHVGSVDQRDDCLLLGGTTTSADFPVNRAIQPSPGGGDDGFVARICETDVLAQRDPAVALVEVIERLERIEVQLLGLDLSSITDGIGRLEECCAETQGHLGDVEDLEEEILSRIDGLDTRLDDLAQGDPDELLRDIETSLFRRECVPWLWLPEGEGHLGLARDHVARRIADAEASGDSRVNLPVARARLADADAELAGGHFEDACKRLSDALHALTTP